MALLWALNFIYIYASKYALRLLNPRLGCVPGPLFGRLSSLYCIWLLSDSKGPINCAELHKKYGPVVQTGPKNVSLCDSLLIPVVYKARNTFLKVSPLGNMFPLNFRLRPLS